MFETRRKQYLNQVENGSVSLFFAGSAPQKSADQSYPFHVNRQFFYLSGITQPQAVLMLVKGENDQAAYLFVEKQDPVKALWDGPVITFEKAAETSGVEVACVRDITTLKIFLHQLLSTTRRAVHGPIGSLYLDLERQSPDALKTEAGRFCDMVHDTYPFLDIKASHDIMARLRMVKDDVEVDKIKDAIALTRKGLDAVVKSLKPGQHEYEAQAAYTHVLNLHRKNPAFDIIAASGKNATVLHYGDNKDKMQKEDLLLLDLGVEVDGYHSDITRVYPVSGRFTKRQKDIYEVVLAANKKTIAWLKAGVTLKEFNDYGKAILIEGAKKLGLITSDEEINKVYYHSLGHYLGLDVHDVGDHSLPIPAGAVITVEPGLYVADEGIGIRIEDDVLVTKDGAVNLSAGLVKEIDEIEALFR